VHDGAYISLTLLYQEEMLVLAMQLRLIIILNAPKSIFRQWIVQFKMLLIDEDFNSSAYSTVHCDDDESSSGDFPSFLKSLQSPLILMDPKAETSIVDAANL